MQRNLPQQFKTSSKYNETFFRNSSRVAIATKPCSDVQDTWQSQRNLPQHFKARSNCNETFLRIPSLVAIAKISILPQKLQTSSIYSETFLRNSGHVAIASTPSPEIQNLWQLQRNLPQKLKTSSIGNLHQNLQPSFKIKTSSNCNKTLLRTSRHVAISAKPSPDIHDIWQLQPNLPPKLETKSIYGIPEE